MAELVQEIDATSFAYLHIPADTGKPIVERETPTYAYSSRTWRG